MDGPPGGEESDAALQQRTVELGSLQATVADAKVGRAALAARKKESRSQQRIEVL